ncbi:hypothetical protein [Brevibacterium oceani]|uniref:hypothetical protein n=1 Tax=Brevibacterium oceani TaxID=358099 RepID=UPI0015E63CEF|nr:hypothetical protein [Brevibacterium oceani]
MTEKTTAASALQELRSRILDAWAGDRIYIDEIIAPGLTDRQVSAIERASAETAQTGLPHFIAIVSEVPIGSDDDWMRFSSDLAYTMHEERGAEQTLVLFSQAGGGAKTQAYLVDDNGPAIPPESRQLTRSASDDFLPVELAVPHQLKTLVAAAEGTDAPAAPDFDTRETGDRHEDYISATGLTLGNPDALVFGAVAVTALGLGAWLMRRRERYSWKTALTTQPELVRSRALTDRADAVLEPLPEPAEAVTEIWDVYDRGRRVQDALTLLIDNHPDWADSPDFAHRHAVNTLISTDRWVRAQLRSRQRTRTEPPGFCFLFPHHTKGIEEFVLRQQGTNLTVDLCADCRTEVEAGHEPARLMVPKRPGSKRPVPYYLRDDAYAHSGFGSFQPLEDVLLESGCPDTSTTDVPPTAHTLRTNMSRGRR